MLSERVSKLDGFLDPGAVDWAGVSATSVDMVPAPLGLQPNEYIQVSWEDRDYGALESLDAKSVHDGERIALWLSWEKAPFKGQCCVFALVFTSHICLSASQSYKRIMNVETSVTFCLITWPAARDAVCSPPQPSICEPVPTQVVDS